MTKDNLRNRVLRLPEVERLAGMKKSTIYKLIQDGTFPRPVRIGIRAVGWREEDLLDWRVARPLAGRFVAEDA